MNDFERYFQEPGSGEPYLKPGMSGVACRNLRNALTYLHYRVPSGDDYDEKLREAVRQFQADCGHKHKDGVLGPGTRRLLIQKLIDRYGDSIFKRLEEPGPPPRKARPRWCPGDFQALAALVDRDAPGLDEVLTVARRALGCGLGDLLDAAGDGGIYGAASALYEALRCTTEIHYDYEPANPGEGSQEIRPAREVLADGVGTCLDLALLFAALLERGHLAPALLVADAGGTWHALAGYFAELQPTAREVVLTGADKVRHLVEQGVLTVVEVTGLSTMKGAKKDFYQARKEGLETFRRCEPLAVVNVLAARARGLLPAKA